MLCSLIAESAGHCWQTPEFENMANPDFENLKHLQNLGHFFLTATSIGLIFCNIKKSLLRL